MFSFDLGEWLFVIAFALIATGVEPFVEHHRLIVEKRRKEKASRRNGFSLKDLREQNRLRAETMYRRQMVESWIALHPHASFQDSIGKAVLKKYLDAYAEFLGFQQIQEYKYPGESEVQFDDVHWRALWHVYNKSGLARLPPSPFEEHRSRAVFPKQ